MRAIFNRGKFAERTASGEMRRVVKRSKETFNTEIANWVPGTLSQEIRYYDKDDNLVAKTHRYLRPDGKLAASGMEDPKRVVESGTMYILQVPDESVQE